MVSYTFDYYAERLSNNGQILLRLEKAIVGSEQIKRNNLHYLCKHGHYKIKTTAKWNKNPDTCEECKKQRYRESVAKEVSEFGFNLSGFADSVEKLQLTCKAEGHEYETHLLSLIHI